MSLESQIQYKILRYLKTLEPAFFFKAIMCNTAGVPDIVGLYRGKSIWIEVKSAKGKVSDLQRHIGQIIQKSGGYYTVARSVDDVVELIKRIDNE